jgi:hypothetical protein
MNEYIKKNVGKGSFFLIANSIIKTIFNKKHFNSVVLGQYFAMYEFSNLNLKY